MVGRILRRGFLGGLGSIRSGNLLVNAASYIY